MQSTRDRLRKERRRRRVRLLRFICFCIVCVALLAAGWQWVRQPGFAFGSINIEGSDKVSTKDILQITGAQEPVNLFVISPWQVEKALTHDVRFEKADVAYSWPGVMRVKITERRPAIYLACSYKGYAKVDYNGVVMQVSDGIKDANAPILSGVVTGNIYFGDKITEKQVQVILEFLSQLDSDVVAHISEIAVDKDSNVKFYLQYGYPILLGNVYNIMDKINLFVTVFNEIKAKNIRAEFIDLTFTKPYIKLKQ
ncbi:FtsQ-type POTRA domain-containing protein [Phascolarctobacterium sp.]|uniref:cell division protein FtsQ/DivIB n=1 Tax=Phascolarctobacterium sp. TaxID=2049039 RepID=UPI0030769878